MWKRCRKQCLLERSGSERWRKEEGRGRAEGRGEEESVERMNGYSPAALVARLPCIYKSRILLDYNCFSPVTPPLPESTFADIHPKHLNLVHIMSCDLCDDTFSILKERHFGKSVDTLSTAKRTAIKRFE